MQLAQHGIIGKSQKSIYLFLNAGQSNDEKGVLLTSVDLTAPYQVPFPQVQYYGDDGVFRSLDWSDQDAYQAPINGVTDNYANQFYLYPRLAAALGTNHLFVCSYSVGDTNLATDWSSTGPGSLYTAMVNRIMACKTLLISTYGVLPIVPFFLWDQGEKDGRVTIDANAYGTNITNFINNLRIDISEPNLKFLMPLITQASINGSPNPVQVGATVNNRKISSRSADPNPSSIVLLNVNDCEPSSDGVHFTATGQYDKNTLELQAVIDAGWVPGIPSPAIPGGQVAFSGYSSFTRFGDVLDALFAAAVSWRTGVTCWKPARYGLRTFVAKFDNATANRSFHFFYSGMATIGFNMYFVGGTTANRSVTWTMPASFFDGNEHTMEWRYNGTVNTNDGLDRIDFYYDGALYTTGKTLSVSVGALGTIFNSNAQLAVGGLVNNAGTQVSTNFFASGWMREFFVQNGSGVDQVRVPNLLTGTDTSGNGLNGTFVP